MVSRSEAEGWLAQLKTKIVFCSVVSFRLQARAPGKMEGGRAVGLPGVFFVYDFSSFLVRKTEEATQPSFLRFLTRICAVVGGVFTVAGLIDSLVYHGSKAMKKD